MPKVAKKKLPNAKRFVLTEEANAVDYLEKAYEFIRRVKRDQWIWKWIVISLHGALYSFAVCAIKGTNSARVTKRLQSGEQLLDFPEVIQRCQDQQWMRLYTYSKVLKLTDQEKDSVDYLHKVHAQIERYVPMRWIINEHDLTVAAVDALRAVHFLAFESRNVSFQDREHPRAQAEIYASKATRLLKQSQPYKDFLASTKRLERSKDS